MSLLIKNGQITTATDQYVADILCDGETIAAIGRNLTAPAGAEVIDASGKYVFPGFIDPHVHIYLPFMGTFAKDDYDSASRAALVGGTTTLIEMCCPSKQEDALEGFNLWMSKAEGISACDFTFHMSVSRFDAKTEEQLRQIVKRGISSFKIFLAYKDFFGLNDAELFNTLRLAKELGVIVTAHCEKRNARGRAAETTDWRRQDRAGVARAVATCSSRGRGCASPDDVCRRDRARTSTSFTPAIATRFGPLPPPGSAAFTYGSKPSRRIWFSMKRTPKNQTSRAPNS